MITADSLIAEAVDIAKRLFNDTYLSVAFDPSQPMSLYGLMTHMDSLDLIEYAMDVEEALWDRNCHVNFDNEMQDDVSIIASCSNQTKESFDAAALRIAEAIAKRCNKE